MALLNISKLGREKERLLWLLEKQREINRNLARQLIENENRLRVIVESEPELVMLQGANGKVLEMNPAGLSIVDAEVPEEIIGSFIHSILAPEFRDSYDRLSEAVFHGQTQILEFRIVGLRETVHWLEMHAFPLRDATNQIIALIGIARDITQRKLAEEVARKHQVELARITRLTTMGEMASGIAHELNQPLSAIANFADGCVRRIRGGKASYKGLIAVLEQICQQADRAGQIIRHMRNFARKRDAKRSCVDINTVVREVLGFLEPEARQNRIALKLMLANELPSVSGDSIELEQVMVNLVRNAIEAITDRQQGIREIMISTIAASPKEVEVIVEDSGPGVSPEMIDQIFDQFATSKASGMGMGLSISRSIIEAHGGHLKLAQEGFPGGRFVFSLPISAAT